MADGKIFVQVASYRDPELLPTLRDCVARAERQDLLAFGIAWQHDESEALDEFAADPRVRVVDSHWRDSLGTCWARAALQQLYRGEEYTLALDSHHRFLPGWDTALKTQLHRLDRPKPVLTGYLPGYQPGLPVPSKPQPVILAANGFGPGEILHYTPYVVDEGDLSAPIPARFYSGHFAFARGSFIEEVPYDPNLYFNGEEITMSIRAFTHGYDLFHPHEVRILHRYGCEGRPIHWNDHKLDGRGAVGAWRLDHRSKQRVRVLLGMEDTPVDFGRYGLGQVRTLHDYESFAGIDFAARHLSDRARFGEQPALPAIRPSFSAA